MLNIMKFRPLFYLISGLLLLTAAFSIYKWHFKTGIDFAGGTVWEMSFTKNVTSQKLESIFADNQLKVNSISLKDKHAVVKLQNISQNDKLKLSRSISQIDPQFHDLRFETLGPSLGKELIQKTIIGVILATASLLVYIGSRFSDWTFGLAAVLAMFHDTFILIGSFALFGHLFGAELDSLFVTALLTTLSSSVHDTVVTFDRMREMRRQSFKFNWVELANQAVSEVIVRSINNSMTVIFMLTALVVLGGETTRWFATALLVGVVCGTYSSTGVAIPLVLFFKNRLAQKTVKNK